MKRPRDGSILRSPKDQRRYYKYVAKHKVADCDFCEYHDSPEVVKEYPQFLVIPNLFPYTVWDGVNVLDHMMLIPKRHVTSMSNFTEEESLEHTKLLGHYEDQGYSVYARSHMNNLKSVPHQHTHLIKTGSKQKRVMLFVSKPHVLISR